MSLVIGHEPAYYSCCATVDLNQSVRQVVENRYGVCLNANQDIATAIALDILKEVKAKSEAKAKCIFRAIVITTFIAPIVFAITMLALNAMSVPVLCAALVPVAFGVLGGRLELFPFPLMSAYQDQAFQAGALICKFENNEDLTFTLM